jgi:hypothetical protein
MMATHTISDLDYVLSVIELAMSKANFSFTEQINNTPSERNLRRTG